MFLLCVLRVLSFESFPSSPFLRGGSNTDPPNAVQNERRFSKGVVFSAPPGVSQLSGGLSMRMPVSTLRLFVVHPTTKRCVPSTEPPPPLGTIVAPPHPGKTLDTHIGTHSGRCNSTNRLTAAPC
jgi:hypothetical protein